MDGTGPSPVIAVFANIPANSSGVCLARTRTCGLVADAWNSLMCRPLTSRSWLIGSALSQSRWSGCSSSRHQIISGADSSSHTGR